MQDHAVDQLGGPNELHPHDFLQLGHQSELCFRVIKRTYISGAGKVWDPIGWLKKKKPTLCARFDACHKWMVMTLFADNDEEDLNTFWLYSCDDEESSDETWYAFTLYLQQGGTSKATIFPTRGNRAILKMHLPLPYDEVLLGCWI